MVRGLNNMIEQDYGLIERLVRSILGVKRFTQRSPLFRDRSNAYNEKGQLALRNKSAQHQKELIHKLFGLAS